jgi:hypothetical protein
LPQDLLKWMWMRDKERASAMESKVGNISLADLQTLLKVHRVRQGCSMKARPTVFWHIAALLWRVTTEQALEVCTLCVHQTL